jgi:hypothetical protein
MNRLIIRFWIYILPWVVIPAMLWTWSEWSGSWLFTSYVIGLPVFYGYVAPGIATNILKKWRFKGAWVIGAFYWHHGFLYSANMGPLLFLSFLGTPAGALSAASIVRILICTAALNGFVYWWHDILLVRYGMVEIFNRPSKEGRSPEEIVTHYAPLCFSLIGLTYAAGALVAYEVVIVRGRTDLCSVAVVALIGSALMFTLPSLVYRLVED